MSKEYIDVLPTNVNQVQSVSYRDGNPLVEFKIGAQERYLLGSTLRLNGVISIFNMVVRGREAPGVVTKEVGKRRRRSPDDAALNMTRSSHAFKRLDSGFAPVLSSASSRRISFIVFFRFLRAIGDKLRGTSTGRQPLGLVIITSFPPGAWVGGPGIAPNQAVSSAARHAAVAACAACRCLRDK